MPSSNEGGTKVEVGQRYVGWGKTWQVFKVFEEEGVVWALNVANPDETIHWPATQFVEETELDG